MNITKCPKCERSLIEEELQNHHCKEQVLDYKIKGNTLWMFNGQDWFPMELANRRVTRRKTTDEVKDPYSIRFIRYWYRTIR